MPRLHARDHAELREARYVRRVQALHVDHLVAGVARAVEGPRVLHRVQDGPDAPVAGRVHEALEAAGVQLRQQFRELLRRVEGLAPVRAASAVRLQQRGRTRFHHVVDVQLERADPQPVPGEPPCRVGEFVQVGVAGAARVEQCRDDP